MIVFVFFNKKKSRFEGSSKKKVAGFDDEKDSVLFLTNKLKKRVFFGKNQKIKRVLWQFNWQCAKFWWNNVWRQKCSQIERERAKEERKTKGIAVQLAILLSSIGTTPLVRANFDRGSRWQSRHTRSITMQYTQMMPFFPIGKMKIYAFGKARSNDNTLTDGISFNAFHDWQWPRFSRLFRAKRTASLLFDLPCPFNTIQIALCRSLFVRPT